MLDKTPENETLQREMKYATSAAGKAEAKRKLEEGALRSSQINATKLIFGRRIHFNLHQTTVCCKCYF